MPLEGYAEANQGGERELGRQQARECKERGGRSINAEVKVDAKGLRKATTISIKEKENLNKVTCGKPPRIVMIQGNK